MTPDGTMTPLAAAPAATAGYPRELEHAIVLDDGRRLLLRPIRPADAPRLVALYDRLSLDSRYHRFFTAMKRLPPDWARFLATVDYRRRLALVVEHDTPAGPEVIAVARYDSGGGDDAAEVAFVVDDPWQGLGLGTRLLGDLLQAAEARGLHRFRAYVLADNTRMLDLLTRFTDVRARRIDAGVIDMAFTPRRTVE